MTPWAEAPLSSLNNMWVEDAGEEETSAAFENSSKGKGEHFVEKAGLISVLSSP